MDVVIALVIEHWIIAGWIVIFGCLAYSQSSDVIDRSVKKGSKSLYEPLIKLLFGVIVVWLIISVIAFIKFMWFAV